MRMSGKLAGALAFVAAGILVAVLEPVETLSPAGHRVLAGLACGVGFWIFQPGKIPIAATTCLVLTVFLAAGINQKLVFSGFVSSAIWVLLPATAFGYVLTKTGLGQRLALLVIRTFRPSYLNMTIAWLIIGLILSAFTPSIVIRIAIVMPIALNCTNVLGLEKGSRGSAFILLIAWAMAIVPGSGWLTGSLWGPISMGMYEKVEALKPLLTSGSWASAMALPMALLTALLIAGIYLVLRPAPLRGLTRDAFQEAYRALGPWTRHEKISTVILVVTFLLFVTEKLHGVGVVPICLGAFFAFYALGVLVTDDIPKGIAWNLIIFLGGVLSFTSVFESTGVSAWLEKMILPALTPFGRSPLVFVMVVTLFMFAWRFIDIAWMIPTMTMLITLLPGIHARFGIHPLVTSCMMVMAGNFALLAYMQPFAVMGSTLAGEKSWTEGQLLRYGAVYAVACLLTLAASTVYWKAAGFIG